MKRFVLFLMLLVAATASAVVVVQRGRGFFVAPGITPVDPGLADLGWNFNSNVVANPTNTIIDVSGNGNYGLVQGTGPDYHRQWQPNVMPNGEFGSEFYARGFWNSSVRSADPVGVEINFNTNMSVGVWVKIPSSLTGDTANGANHLFGKGTWAQAGSWHMVVNSDLWGYNWTNFHVGMWPSGVDERVHVYDANLNDDEWHLVGMEYDAANQDLYAIVDGQYRGTNTSVASCSNSTWVSLAGYNATWPRGFYFHEVFVIRNQRLNESSWSNYYNHGTFPTNGDLVLHWKFTNSYAGYGAPSYLTNAPSATLWYSQTSRTLYTNDAGQGWITLDGVNDVTTLYQWFNYGRIRQGQPRLLSDTNALTVTWWRRDSDPSTFGSFYDLGTVDQISGNATRLRVGGTDNEYSGLFPPEAISLRMIAPGSVVQYASASNAYTAADADTWINFGMVWDASQPAGEKVKFYRNGYELSCWTNGITANPFNSPSGGPPLARINQTKVGSNPEGTDTARGDMDDVFFWDRALSPEEMLGLYNRGRD